jgi:hypothetical protein
VDNSYKTQSVILKNMNIIEHAEGVYEVEEFLSHSHQDILLSLTGDNGWDTTHPGNIVKKFDENIMKSAIEINAKVETFFSNFTKIKRLIELRRLRDNEFMHLHKDEGDPRYPEPIVFGVAIYINDDFTGGELVYPELSLTVKPKPRSMVIHKAKYSHEVLPVTSGSRYSITTFILGDESTRFIG